MDSYAGFDTSQTDRADFPEPRRVHVNRVSEIAGQLQFRDIPELGFRKGKGKVMGSDERSGKKAPSAEEALALSVQLQLSLAEFVRSATPMLSIRDWVGAVKGCALLKAVVRACQNYAAAIAEAGRDHKCCSPRVCVFIAVLEHGVANFPDGPQKAQLKAKCGHCDAMEEGPVDIRNKSVGHCKFQKAFFRK